MIKIVLISIIILTAPNGNQFNIDDQSTYRTTGKSVAAFKEEDLKLVINYFSDKDLDAVQKLIDEERAFKVKKDLVVYLLEAKISGISKVRLKGSDITFWVVSKEIVENKI